MLEFSVWRRSAMPVRHTISRFRQLCFAGGASLVLSSQAAGVATADILYEAFDKNRNSNTYQLYLQGLAEGISWANTISRNEGHGLYCPPEKMVITSEQYLDI